jgi:EAL domain-containing protein (putative c-di-GMP-specific phosphodiesterase class I)
VITAARVRTTSVAALGEHARPARTARCSRPAAAAGPCGPQVAVELTEYTQVSDYLELISITERLRSASLLIVIDDAGTGHASFHHILQLRPDIMRCGAGADRIPPATCVR